MTQVEGSNACLKGLYRYTFISHDICEKLFSLSSKTSSPASRPDARELLNDTPLIGLFAVCGVVVDCAILAHRSQRLLVARA